MTTALVWEQAAQGGGLGLDLEGGVTRQKTTYGYTGKWPSTSQVWMRTLLLQHRVIYATSIWSPVPVTVTLSHTPWNTKTWCFISLLSPCKNPGSWSNMKIHPRKVQNGLGKSLHFTSRFIHRDHATAHKGAIVSGIKSPIELSTSAMINGRELKSCPGKKTIFLTLCWKIR